MKTIETKGGMIFEIWESRKEVLHDIEMLEWDNLDCWVDDSLYIEYKDGSYFSVTDTFGVEGKFKKTNIKTVIYGNSATTCVYGNYRIYNMDNTSEEYSEEIDSEEHFWNVDAA